MYTIATSASERQMLLAAGFLHVTFLVVRTGSNDAMVLRCHNEGERGIWIRDGFHALIITSGGEFWLGYHESVRRLGDSLLERLCPQGETGKSPYEIKHWRFNQLDLLQRLANPDCNPLRPISSIFV